MSRNARRLFRCAAGLALAGLIAPAAAAPTLRLTPTVCAPNDRLTLQLPADSSLPPAVRSQRRLDVVITDAYRGAQIARATVALRPEEGGLAGQFAFQAEPGVYAIQGAEGGAAITTRAQFIVRGMIKAGSWWMPSHQPLLGARLASGVITDESVQLLSAAGFNTLVIGEGDPIATTAVLRRTTERLGSLLIIEAAGSDAGEPVIDARGLMTGGLCPVAAGNRERMARKLELLARAAGGDQPGLILLPPPTPAGVCYCAACSAAFRHWRGQRATGVELPMEPPREAGLASPAHARLWEDFQFQLLPAFIAWLTGRLRASVPGLSLAVNVDPARVDLDSERFALPTRIGPPAAVETRFHTGTDLAQLAEPEIALVTEVTSENVAANVTLLTAAAGLRPGAELLPERPVWALLPGSRGEGTRRDNLMRLEALFRGATGVIAGPPTVPDPNSAQEWRETSRFVAEHANLFIGARSGADVGVVFPAAAERLPREGMGPEARRDYIAMMRGLVASHWSPRAVWPDLSENLAPSQLPMLFVPAEGALSARFVERLRRYVESGGHAYVEGATLYDAGGKRTTWLLKELLGMEVEPTPRRRTEMMLDDLWIFGKQKVRLTVEQTGAVVKLNGARLAGRLADGTPGLVSRRVGLGEVLFSPTRMAALASLDSRLAITAADYAQYCDAVASSWLSPAIHVRGNPARPAPVPDVRCAVLRARGVTMFGLFNYGAAQSLEITLDSPHPYTCDLRTRRALGLPDDRARFKTHTLQLRALDWAVLANAESSDALEKEIRQAQFGLTVK